MPPSRAGHHLSVDALRLLHRQHFLRGPARSHCRQEGSGVVLRERVSALFFFLPLKSAQSWQQKIAHSDTTRKRGEPGMSMRERV